jgi:hypothetical protein
MIGELVRFEEGLTRPRGRRAIVDKLAESERALLRLHRLSRDPDRLLAFARAALAEESPTKICLTIQRGDRRLRGLWRTVQTIEPKDLPLFGSVRQLVEHCEQLLTAVTRRGTTRMTSEPEIGDKPGSFWPYVYRDDGARVRIGSPPQWMVRDWLKQAPLPKPEPIKTEADAGLLTLSGSLADIATELQALTEGFGEGA